MSLCEVSHTLKLVYTLLKKKSANFTLGKIGIKRDAVYIWLPHNQGFDGTNKQNVDARLIA